MIYDEIGDCSGGSSARFAVGKKATHCPGLGPLAGRPPGGPS